MQTLSLMVPKSASYEVTSWLEEGERFLKEIEHTEDPSGEIRFDDNLESLSMLLDVNNECGSTDIEDNDQYIHREFPHWTPTKERKLSYENLAFPSSISTRLDSHMHEDSDTHENHNDDPLHSNLLVSELENRFSMEFHDVESLFSSFDRIRPNAPSSSLFSNIDYPDTMEKAKKKTVEKKIFNSPALNFLPSPFRNDSNTTKVKNLKDNKKEELNKSEEKVKPRSRTNSSTTSPKQVKEKTIHLPIVVSSIKRKIDEVEQLEKVVEKEKRIGIYSPSARRKRIEQFLEKRKSRIWKKCIKYDCRKKLADDRPRIKGRFAKRPGAPEKSFELSKPKRKYNKVKKVESTFHQINK